VIIEKVEVFNPDKDGRAQKYVYLADRIDYLEAVCAGVNAAIAKD
jgi:hypothetical protein